MDMGFSEQESNSALSASSGNFDQALQFLVEDREAKERHRRASAAERRISRTQPKHTSKPLVPPVVTSQPPVKADARMDELARNYLVGRPQVIDTLHYVLKTLHQHPSEPKYRSLKTTNARYRETLGGDPQMASSVEEFLGLLGFSRSGDWLSVAPGFDMRPIATAVKVLEDVQANSEVYHALKRNQELEKAMEVSVSSASQEELARRQEFVSQLPAIPLEGAAGTTRISITVAKGAPPLKRRFVSDDTLQDVVNWIGSERSVVAVKISEGVWRLADKTLLQHRVFSKEDFPKTLHALDLWPSAELEVRLT